MRPLTLLLRAGCLLSAASSALGSSWSFSDASIAIKGKGAGVGSGLKEKLSPTAPLTQPILLSPSESIKIILTTTEGKSAKKPNQAFLLLKDTSSNLDISYPLTVSEAGKAKLDLAHKDLPISFLRNPQALQASIVIGSFGASQGLRTVAFTLQPSSNSGLPASALEKPLRYGKLQEIHHIFRGDPKSPPAVISAVFALAAITTLPLLLVTWLFLGGNLNHLSKALSDAPISHALFVGSIVGLEGTLFLYYTMWNLFQTLPVLTALGVVALLSGSRALTEVQERRLAGLR